jgi:peroxiredoxin
LYEDRLIALHKKYAPLGYPVVAINPNDEAAYPDDSFDNMVIRAREKGFTFAYLRDETKEVARRFGATKTPHVYVVQRQWSKLVVQYIGAIDNNSKAPAEVTERYVEDALNSLLAGQPVAKNQTKAVGCSMKYKL